MKNRLKLCECGWAVKWSKGRWVHVQTDREEHITKEEAESWLR